MTMRPALLWLRRDLRLSDHEAWADLCSRGVPVVPLFIWSPEEERPWAPGAASRWWLHHSLAHLGERLREKDSRLTIRRGPTLSALRAVLEEVGADEIHWHQRPEPVLRDRDEKIRQALEADGKIVCVHGCNLLHQPTDISTQEGTPYKVFTPFWKACTAGDEPDFPNRAPQRIETPGTWPSSLELGELNLLPKIDWDEGLYEAWTPGEEGARQALRRFLRSGLNGYDGDRDRPDRVGTSRLSPHLHFGEITPQQIWHGVRHQMEKEDRRALTKDAKRFLAEVGWREFAHHLLWHYPRTTDEPLREEFGSFPWKPSGRHLERWQRGQTGYPIVDAGMRELWRTGWMHNRVRMIVASFLVKDLLIPWQEGAKWFWDTLVDADLANNTLGWQWTAGCGADAAPYFRVFNPILQGKRFDPSGEYVRRWVPELADLPTKHIHAPWEAPSDVLGNAGVELGSSYPRPIVDHGEARQRALDAYEEVKGGTAKA